MGKGRYLKAAERACARKARFETGAAARAFVEGRYGAYRCVVCGGYHLTSGRGERPERTPTLPSPKGEAGPKLGDLDWSAVLEPKVSPVLNLSPPPPLLDEALGEGENCRTARCAGRCGKDGRVLLVLEGRLVKSATVERTLRTALGEGVTVEVDASEPPRVLRAA